MSELEEEHLKLLGEYVQAVLLHGRLWPRCFFLPLSTEERPFNTEQLPPKVDFLSEETFAFYSHGITQNATRYFSVPFKTFLDLAQAMPDPAPNLLFVWSTGRCGSTLISKLLHTDDRVAASLSEPPVIATLHRLTQSSVVNIHDNATWIRSVIKMLFKNWSSKDEIVCVKPHPVAIELVPLLKSAMPQVKNCFLYRDSAPNVESWHSLLNSSALVEKEGDRALPPGACRVVVSCIAQTVPLMGLVLASERDPPPWLNFIYGRLLLHSASGTSRPFRFARLPLAPTQAQSASSRLLLCHHASRD